ncbi:hypothetical protein [Adhaeribacter pallidiroseus]|uniref:Phosphatidate cytidylyltransferase n=1 Tax=Adhaeribacter pallidiroseus TaxID=2072847 RepID=A0A369QN72_9BACT|nr:hypothetical protein [Adhaeribacter pallidiroseus]RDC64309.1 hypothetical protein AHMF7616_02922 [Adhaeribacter pallidiroseus]
MKSFRYYFSILLIFLTLTITSCEVVGDIFKAGMWTAVIGIIIVVLFVLWIVRKIRGPRL